MRWRGGGASVGIIIVIILSLVSFSISNELSMIGFWGEQRGGFAATPRHFSAKMVRGVCVGTNIVSSDFRSFTHFNLPIAGKTFPSCLEGHVTQSLSRFRPCESNVTDIVNLNFRCSASKLSRRKKTKNSRRKKGRGKERTRRWKKIQW